MSPGWRARPLLRCMGRPRPGRRRAVAGWWWSYEDATTGGPLTREALAANEAALLAGFPDLHFDLVSMAPPATPRPLPSG